MGSCQLPVQVSRNKKIWRLQNDKSIYRLPQWSALQLDHVLLVVWNKLKFDWITLNFLVSDHSQNENHSGHSVIGFACRLCSIYTTNQWEMSFQMAFKKMHVRWLTSSGKELDSQSRGPMFKMTGCLPLARKHKEDLKVEAEISRTYLTATFELEKILPVQHGHKSSSYYSRRQPSKNHSLTVTNISSMETYCFLSNEEDAGKGRWYTM